MFRFSTLLGRVAVAALLGAMVLLAGCHRGNAKDDAAHIAQLQRQFDATVQAYKNGQFIMDGAVLSATDLSGHFSYLKDQGKLPKTVLLTSSDDSKVRKVHLQFMARLQIDYGFVVYYEQKGNLVKIDAVDTKARDLEDYQAPKAAPEQPPPTPDHSQGY
jgi:hypothetical protein